jgi:cell division inhibitor SepF
MWRKAMVALGLQDDEDDAEFMGFDSDYGDDVQANSYAQPQSRPAPVRSVREQPTMPTRPSNPAARSHAATEAPTVRTVAASEPARPSSIRTMPMTAPASSSVHVCEPKSFNDAQEIGERLKLSRPVIMNLSGLPRELQRRLIDFASGLAFALDGSMSRVDEHVFLLSPSNQEVSLNEADYPKNNQYQ